MPGGTRVVVGKPAGTRSATSQSTMAIDDAPGGALRLRLSVASRLPRDGFTRAVLLATVVALLVFIVWPLANSTLAGLASAWRSAGSGAAAKLGVLQPDVWRLACLRADGACGSGWHTIALGVAATVSSTLLGTALALLVSRGRLARSRVGGAVLRAIALLPVITPPFAVGLALILLLGRNGAITRAVASLFDIPAGRWLYGPIGLWLAQCLAFTPVAFLTVLGVVQRLPAVLEEAAATLRASRWQTFKSVTLPMMRPGLANALLLCFIESLADFGNPLVLGGNFRVLSSDLYFAVVGAAQDPGRAAALAVWLLLLALAVFALQRRWLGERSFVALGGKGGATTALPLDTRLSWGLAVLVMPWCLLTAAVYGTLLAGGFVTLWGVDFHWTTAHLVDVFGIDFDGGAPTLTGQAWPSALETLRLSAIAAPLTAAVAILGGWLIARRQFPGRRWLEGALVAAFAIPGTVIGLAYAQTFNAAPLMLTGTGGILVLSFVFRNMPMGLRTTVGALAQIDPSLDEASATLRAGHWTTLRRVLLPLLRPACAAALIYGFVRAATAVSAVVFLVSADHDLATTYLIGLISNGSYGPALAYAGVLVVALFIVVVSLEGALRAGERRLAAAPRHNHAVTRAAKESLT